MHKDKTYGRIERKLFPMLPDREVFGIRDDFLWESAFFEEV